MSCEPCKTQTPCLQFPIVFYNFGSGKSYANDLLSYDVLCPNGLTVTIYIQPGTITFRLPFPVGFTGDYPPLVMACPAGGYIVRNIPSGSTQAAIDALVNSMIYDCGKALAEQQAACPAPAFGNDAVIFNPACAVGSVLTYSGTLPAWITINLANNTLVGAAGIFTAASVAAATALAQSALDTWATAQIALGNLTCVSGPGCIAQINSVAQNDGNQYGVYPTRDAATTRLLVADAIATDTKLYSTTTDTLVATIAFDTLGFMAGFSTSNQHWFLTNSITLNVYDNAGAFVANIALPDFISWTVYSVAQDRVYSLYFDSIGTGTTHIIAINPATNTIVVDSDTTVNYGLPVQLFNLKEMLAFVDATNFMFFYAIPGLTLSGSVNLNPGGFGGGACYATNADKILIGAFNSVTFNAEIWQINPVTFAKEFAYTPTAVGASVFSLEYNATTGAVIGKQTDGTLLVIDPVAQTIVCQIAGGGNTNAIVDAASGKVYTQDATNLLVFD